jgi:His-Xaa-Ser system radical SAM maturase HxsB
VPVRFREVAGKVVLTNPWGDWIAIGRDDLDVLAKRPQEMPPALEARLRERRFLRSAVDRDDVAARFARRSAHVARGPNLHIFVVTLRCNETCVYCHASRAGMDREDTDMSPAVAERCVDLALESTSPSITIELQGGEPLANFPVVRHIIDYARRRNEARGKAIDFTLVSNLALMDEEKLAYLVDRRVQICTSVDGPAALHDRQRRLAGGSAHAEAVRWIRRLNERYVAMGLDPSVYHVEALLTTTSEALERPREIVDAYVDLGCRALFLRPVDPFGFASRKSSRAGSPEAAGESYADFYRAAVDYMIELNRGGVQILERFASIFLTKILTPDDPNYLDIRSPCGAGVGQLAYNHDGRIYTCDEGRMLAAAGDDFFRIGEVPTAKYRSLMLHPTVRAMLLASSLDGQPGCATCAYRPYCGICPVFNYATQGSLHGRMPESAWCRGHMGIQDYLFTKLIDGDPTTLSTFERWITARPRSHYVHSRDAS